MREDPQQEVRPRCGIVRALDHQRGAPARVEAFPDVWLRLREVEALFVPLQHGVATYDALLVAAFIRTPAVLRGMLALANGRRARMKQDPLVDVRILRLGALGIRFSVQLFPDSAEVVKKHAGSRLTA